MTAPTGSNQSRFKRKNSCGSRTGKGCAHDIDDDDGSGKVKCKYCGKVFGTFQYENHLEGTHNNVEGCVSFSNDVNNEFTRSSLKNVDSTQKKQKTFHGDDGDDNCKRIREDVCQQIARFFYTSAIPFNAVKNPEFEKMLEMIGGYGIGLKPPSCHELREKHLNKEVACTARVIDVYKAEWKRTGCSILCDGWTDRKQRSIVNFMVNCPRGTVFISSVDTSDISKAADVCKMLDDIVSIVGEENVLQVVTGTDTNYKAGGELLMEKRKILFWTPCAAQCIDLMLEDLDKKLDVHGETIKKGKNITTYIYSSNFLIAMLRHFTKGRDLLRPGATRYATTYLTLGSLSKHKGALTSMFSSNAWKTSKYAATTKGKTVHQIVLDGEFWKNVVICLRAAYPLVRVLRMVDSSEKPTMGYIYDAMDRAKEKIRENFSNVKKRYELIWNIIDVRWESQLWKPLHAAAYFLNPQLTYRPNFKIDPDVKFGLYYCMMRMVPDAAVRRKLDPQIQYFKEAKGLFGMEVAIAARQTKPPHMWWDAYGDECPELQKFAIRILSLTCSLSGCERNSGVLEMVHSRKRNPLHQKKINDLVNVKYNSKLDETRRRKDKGPMIIRKDKEPMTFEEIESDDEWIREKEENEDSYYSQFFQLDAEQETEEQAEEELRRILPQKDKDDLDLEIPDDMESGSDYLFASDGEGESEGEGDD